jgi:cell division protease FtsH
VTQPSVPRQSACPATSLPFRPAIRAATLRTMGDEVREFAVEYQRFVRRMSELAGEGDGRHSVLRERIDAHLGRDSAELPVVSEGFAPFDKVIVQVAMTAYLERGVRRDELLGLAGGFRHNGSFSDILQVPGYGMGRNSSVEYRNLPVGPTETLACVQFGVFLISERDRRLAVMMRGPDEHGMQSGVSLEVISGDEDAPPEFLAEIRTLVVELNVFRGQVISFGTAGEFDHHGLGPVVFFERPDLRADQLILPETATGAIEAQVFGIARQKERLLASGQHLKRGLLLHGPPGTGKTLTVRYLISNLRGHTVVLLTGRGLHRISAACGLARLLQPSVVVLEDVDLVAEERGVYHGNPVLFEVLNEMDGIEEDADVVFLLTTNRADRLEPALAARPGRVDLAIEIPLPADDARRRLIELYGREVDLRLDDVDRVVERTAGVTASFVKELMRKAALVSALRSDGNGRIAVTDADINAALDELLAEETSLTRRLLGGAQRTAGAPPRPGTEWLVGFDEE